MIQPFAEKKIWLMTAMRKRPEVNEPGNWQEITRDPTDFTREVHIGKTTTKRTVWQSLVIMFTNMELEIKVIGSPERQRQ
jgi:hypothetical protein